VGEFDGVHAGHREVIRGAGAVLTFEPHPRTVVAPAAAPKLLTTLEQKADLIAALGVGELIVIPFDGAFAEQSPEHFIEEILIGRLNVSEVSVGENFRFGSRRAGSVETLEELGLEVLDVEEVEGVSSTAIRDAVRDGDLAGAAAMLGRPFELDGTVVAGDQRGGTLGYPTANIAMDPHLLCPRYGIYAGEALGHRAAVSIGTNPHYGGTERRIEPFLLDFDGDLYGRRLVVELWERLRDERVFESEDALIAQIGRDVEATRAAARPG
jgi:riboflavin kinase/FMN adenylyltransferase